MQQIINKFNLWQNLDNVIEIYSNQRIGEFEKEDEMTKKLIIKLKTLFYRHYKKKYASL